MAPALWKLYCDLRPRVVGNNRFHGLARIFQGFLAARNACHVINHVVYATRSQVVSSGSASLITSNTRYIIIHLPLFVSVMFKTDVKELLDSADVQDPTDFPPSSTAPGLRALDSALRCNICQELYEAPVVLTCGHCFCSLVRVMVIASARHITGPPLAVCTKPTR